MKIRAGALLYVAIALTSIACGSSATTSVTGPSATRCQVGIGTPSSSFSSSGGTGEVKVTVARECAWSATAQAAWIEITSGKDGQGDGTIAYRVTANEDPVTRKAAIAVGDQHADVAQEAAACRYDVSGPSAPLAASGGETTIGMRTHSACQWSASSSAPWVTLTPSSGKGDADIHVTVAPNPGTERVVALSIGPDNVVVTQESAPPAAPIPVPAPPSPTPTPAPAPTPTPAPAPTPTPTPAPTPTPTPTPAPTPTPTPSPTPDPTPAPAPAPAPAPSPAPAPQPTPIDLAGRIDNPRGTCPSVTFTLKGSTVRTNSATQFTRGTCRDLKDGVSVAMSGFVQDDKTVLATKIEVKK